MHRHSNVNLRANQVGFKVCDILVRYTGIKNAVRPLKFRLQAYGLSSIAQLGG